jgi:molybdopterin-containing oxidoreductase family iron-sulfur binding subunit
MGASLALAGVGGCRWEKEEVLPFVNRPADRTPGKRKRYATAMDLAGSAIGLLVTSVDGRPIKIEGNPEHPHSLGATHPWAQAAILELYDPDRSRAIIEGEQERRWDAFAAYAREHFGGLRKTGGAELCILSEAHGSPTLAAMRSELRKAFPDARWYEHEPVSRDNEREGSRLAFGQPYRAHYALDRANVIVCLDADLLGSHPASVQYARQFAQGREVVDASMSRLYAVESCYSITGAAADHRLALSPAGVRRFTLALWAKLHSAIGPPEAGDNGPKIGVPDRELRFIEALAGDLTAGANRGRSLIVAGRRQPPAVHRAVHAMNEALGNVGSTVAYIADPEPERPSHVEAIAALVKEMSGGNVKTLLVLGGNPVYNAPADLGFAEALRSVPTRIHLSPYRNETSRAATWHVPQAHFLESWGDARGWDGTYSIVQPLIEPLWGGKSAIEVLALLLGDVPPAAHDRVRQTFLQLTGEEGFERRWRTTLHDGVLPDSQWPTSAPKVLAESLEARAAVAESGDGAAEAGTEVVFLEDPSVFDGRFANSGWLQETPDPLTKMTWGNAALMSKATADSLKVDDGALVKVSRGGRELEIPALIVPGQAANTVGLSLGYGRTAAGVVGGSEADGVEPVGADAYRLRTSDAIDSAQNVSIARIGKRHRLAITQEHHTTGSVGYQGQKQRLGELVGEATLEHYKKHPDFARHLVHLPDGVEADQLESLWEEHAYEGHRWGMAIDLSKCIGCNACVVACQAENNIPVVGRDRVIEGREMHWIRIDRYFRGEFDDPAVSFQPVACHHCENAPCEQVCPVAATVHSREGLNDMVYNRCVGTRYCANNCPYKVRRFNYFAYHKDLDDPNNEVAKMAYNPEVTIRSRGVMEKCTYCVQRIQDAKIESKNRRRPIADGRIQTACQQACPTQAIVFGDLGDAESQVALAHKADRAYAMLAELNVKPRTKYLARIRNPNSALEPTDHELDRYSG